MIKQMESKRIVYDIPVAFQIRAVRQENHYTRTLILDGTLEASPGQFVMAWLPDEEDRPYSIVDDNPLTLTVAAVGPFSTKLAQLQVGDLIWLRGPFGRGYQLSVDNHPQRLLLAGDGYLVTSLHFLAKRALDAGHQVTLLLSAESEEDLVLRQAFEALGLANSWLPGNASAEHRRQLLDQLERAMSNQDAVYASGSVDLLKMVASQCQRLGLPFQLAWKTTMKCGIGLCGTCEVGNGWLACTDGPVFSFNPLVTTPSEAF